MLVVEAARGDDARWGNGKSAIGNLLGLMVFSLPHQNPILHSRSILTNSSELPRSQQDSSSSAVHSINLRGDPRDSAHGVR